MFLHFEAGAKQGQNQSPPFSSSSVSGGEGVASPFPEGLVLKLRSTESISL